MTELIIAVAVVVVIVATVAVARSRRAPRDGVESFRRQIDALSQEARRPVIDQVNERRDGDTDEQD